MPTAPYGIRLLIGAAVTALEETKRLPQTILMYPMTLASTVAQLVMKMQQDLADLAIKGDAALDTLFPPKLEQPEWATFDEDQADESGQHRADDKTASPNGNGSRRTEGRFALYSVDRADTPVGSANDDVAKTPAKAERPGIAEELDYESLTLAQLRARLQSLNVAELEALLGYEEASRARAPFQTLLANRITRANAK
ncbi:MAG: lipid droplet-associated protein [Mycobacterium sp.]